SVRTRKMRFRFRKGSQHQRYDPTNQRIERSQPDRHAAPMRWKHATHLLVSQKYRSTALLAVRGARALLCGPDIRLRSGILGCHIRDGGAYSGPRFRYRSGRRQGPGLRGQFHREPDRGDFDDQRVAAITDPAPALTTGFLRSGVLQSGALAGRTIPG